jgi:hypothetical protein
MLVQILVPILMHMFMLMSTHMLALGLNLHDACSPILVYKGENTEISYIQIIIKGCSRCIYGAIIMTSQHCCVPTTVYRCITKRFITAKTLRYSVQESIPWINQRNKVMTDVTYY